ncbi:MAG TPA: MopE-related protein [Chitinophagales bacterium]|nr:MopE-related protein [Chitinophagales bacterium]
MKKLLQHQSICTSAFLLLIVLTLSPAVTSAQCQQGDPSQFGDHVWNVYAWSNGDAIDAGYSWNNSYAGYYVDSGLNFNTQSAWPANGSPSYASGFNGCDVAVDNHSWSARRKGFPCGYYQINVVSHDDEAQLFVDGAKVWEHLECCDQHNNVWSGILGDSSTIVFRATEGVGGSHGAIEFISQNYYSITPLGPTTFCPGYSVQLDAGPQGDYLWSTDETTRIITATTGGEYDVTISLNGCTFRDTIQLAIAQLDTPELSSTIFCPGFTLETTNYNAALTYSWNSPDVVVTGNESHFDNSGSYIFTATDETGCSASSHFNIQGPSGESNFGNGVWQVNAYNQGMDLDYGTSWLPQFFSGYYIDSALSFNSENSWNGNDNPSQATNYTGCSIPSDYMSWSAKRRGFDCGMYQIDILSHDDEGQLFINGVEVWEHDICCDDHMNVWTGLLNDTSTVVFRVTEGIGGSYGSIRLTMRDTITTSGPTHFCPGYSVQLDAGLADFYLWSNGDTSRVITASHSGIYHVLTMVNGCDQHSDDVLITVAPLDTPVLSPVGSSFYFCPQGGTNVSVDNYNSALTYSWEPNFWWAITRYDVNRYNFLIPGNFTLTATDALGCSASAHLNITVMPGEADFGQGVWKVNAYASGGANSQFSWGASKYSGYYVDSTLNFDSENSWSANDNPSMPGNYVGCQIGSDYMSWSAKRQGFPEGDYQIDVLRHDDEAQLLINGAMVVDLSGAASDPSINVWTGTLDSSSQVEFRVTDGTGASYGAISFTLISVPHTYYADNDGDTYGDPADSTSSMSSTAPSGYVSNSDDCDDANASIHPGAAELCNSIDDNCNGVVDDNAIQATVTPGGEVNACKGAPLTLIANTGSGITYSWYKNGNIIPGATGSSYTVNKNGNYYVHETISICSSTSIATNVTFSTLPLATIGYSGSLNLCGNASVLLSANGGSGLSYQWKKGTANIAGATFQTYTATSKGTYKVVVTNSHGCSKTSAGVKVTKTCKSDLTEEQTADATLSIYPNPSYGRFVIEMNSGTDEDAEADLQIFNALGQQVYTRRVDVVSGTLHEEVNPLSNLSPGNYFVRVLVGDMICTGKLVIQ